MQFTISTTTTTDPQQTANRLSTTDEQLIARFCSSRSNDDLEELIARHSKRVRNLAYRIVLCHATADDITQDVFIKVLHHAHDFREQAKFTTWIYQITLNTAKEFLRKQATAHKYVDSELEKHDQPNVRPDQKAMSAELETEIRHALEQLSLKLRTAIVLTAMEHHSPQHAAKIEGCSVTTMYWRIHQARKQLKLLLGRHLQS